MWLNTLRPQTFGGDGAVLDFNKYYWALAEMLAAAGAWWSKTSTSGHQLLSPPADWCPMSALPDHAGLLAVRTGKQAYWDWYGTAWAYAVENFIDAERGGPQWPLTRLSFCCTPLCFQ